MAIEQGLEEMPKEDIPRAIMSAEDHSRILCQTDLQGVSRVVESIVREHADQQPLFE
jgi:hypothetical protein